MLAWTAASVWSDVTPVTMYPSSADRETKRHERHRDMQRVGQNKEHQHALPAQADEKEPDHVQNLPIAELELSPPVARMIAPFYGGDDSRSETERARGSERERVRERERERERGREKAPCA